ncbi:LysR family transcriptional regulator [Dyella sp. Tek66A03]|uniref:LysR family transcriptional regulator n=1 Tax=Dyella sp. Tek66A03 TaxID=3458298 RepID=UPI00403ECD14
MRGAARAVGLDQATVSRRLAMLERALGATLFLRTSNGYVLTPVGEIALRSAEEMEQSANDIFTQTLGVDERLAGEVRVTTTDTIGLDFVMPAIRRLHEAHPDVRVLLDTSTQLQSLAKREADIAIRTIKPENPNLLARKLAAWPMGLYASVDYIERHG